MQSIFGALLAAGYAASMAAGLVFFHFPQEEDERRMLEEYRAQDMAQMPEQSTLAAAAE